MVSIRGSCPESWSTYKCYWPARKGRGKTSIEQLLKLAEALDVSLDYLTGKVDQAIEPKLIQQMASIQELPPKEKEHVLFALRHW